MTHPAEQFAALKAIANGAKPPEEQLKDALLAVYEETGADRWRTAHGTVIIKGANADPLVSVLDEDAFLDWVADRFPTEVETVTPPPPLPVRRVRPAFRDTLVKRLKVYPTAVGDAPMVVDPKTGEVCEWAKTTPAAPPQVSMVGGKDEAAVASKAAAARMFLEAIASGRPVLEAPDGDQS